MSMKKIIFKPVGTCSREITVSVENGIIKEVSFKNGCEGNLRAIEKLVKDLPVQTVIDMLKGIDCNNKGTSCPDQLAKALMKL
jgi:uncharacterized protein (TIGR03905 family)